MIFSLNQCLLFVWDVQDVIIGENSNNASLDEIRVDCNIEQIVSSIQHWKLILTTIFDFYFQKLNKKVFLCHICGNQFKLKPSMMQHIRVHEGRRYICSIGNCYLIFTTRKGLREHKLIHTGERPLNCKICNKTFRYHSGLSQHRKVHSSKKRFWYRFHVNNSHLF